jgi:hypothetical protein
MPRTTEGASWWSVQMEGVRLDYAGTHDCILLPKAYGVGRRR